MGQIADLKIIQGLLKSETGYRIAKDTGIPQQTISRFQNGTTDLENMKIGVGIILTNYALSMQKNNPT